MHKKTFLISIAIALGAVFVAACDRPSTQTGPGDRGTVKAPEPPPAAATPTTPANAGTPTTAEKAEGSNPQQQQVDPKEPQQRRDFQQQGSTKPGG